VTDETQPGFFKTWMIALRPFALPASTMPVIFGTALAWWYGATIDGWHVIMALMAFVAMICLHSGSNLLNDVGDFEQGVDTITTPTSGAVIRKIITPRKAFLAATLLMAVGSALGLALVSFVGLPILYIGLVGVAIGVLYTLGPVALKYHALGDLAVFLNFGILGGLGAWTVQTGSMSWVPAVWAAPIGMLVAGILHANNWRDIDGDTKAKITTVATILGDRASMAYYAFLVYGAFSVVLGILVITQLTDLAPTMPLTFLVVLLALPLAIKLTRRAVRRTTPESPLDFVALDGGTAQLNLIFGLLCISALGLDALIARLI
jgi:1,4-dihydroxy-2-naphthoate octaprenyltransferase